MQNRCWPGESIPSKMRSCPRYRCDVKRVTTINFDRNAIRKYLADMNKAADAASAALDRCLVNGAVEYEAPFDVNDSFADVFAAYTESRK